MKKITSLRIMLSIVLFTFTLLSCSKTQQESKSIVKSDFGKVDGVGVELYTLTNKNGVKVAITNYGGIVTEIIAPDKNNKMEDVVLGYDNVEDYVKVNPYFGAIIGRYGNRIAEGKFSLDGEEFTLATNNAPNHLHGGNVGFDKVIWKAKELKNSGDSLALELSYTSKDGEEGYPGNLEVKIVYTLTNENELLMEYFATTDKKTVCNLTNHTYFNLKDGGRTSINDHLLQISADYFTPVDETLIPTGKLASVSDTPFDFRELRAIGEFLDSEDDQILKGQGYDHNFVLNGTSDEEVRLVSKVIEKTSGRVLEVYTTEPGIQFYGGNFLDGSIVGKDSVVYNHRSGFCLETQHFPDSPNQPEFPSTTLNVGDEYYTKTIYKFAVVK